MSGHGLSDHVAHAAAALRSTTLAVENGMVRFRLTLAYRTITLYVLYIAASVILLSIHFLHLQAPSISKSSTCPSYEIHLNRHAISKQEGIGAVLSGLKPVAMFANYTSALITTSDKRSGHSYRISKYIRVHRSCIPKRRRVACDLSRPIEHILSQMVQQCHKFNFSLLETYGVFRNCNYVAVSGFLGHPRTCVKHTQHLINNLTNWRASTAERNDVCVLRRGGDVERRIMNGEGNMWAIDEQKTVPILRQLSRQGANIVLSTETHMKNIRSLYHADVYSNRERLDVVVQRLSLCRCLFISVSSSFAAAMVQITQPTFIVHTQSRDGFKFDVEPYNYSEYGANALSVLNESEVLRACAEPSNKNTHAQYVVIN